MRRPLSVVCLLFVITVFAYVYLAPPSVAEYEKAEGKTVYLAGKVYQKEVRSSAFGGDNTILYLNQIAVSSESKSLFENEEMLQGVMCYLEGKQEIPLGSFIAVKGNVQSFRTATNPGEFDSRQYYQILKLDFRLKQVKIEKISKSYNRLQEWLYRIKEKCGSLLETYYGGSDAGVMKTILLGDKNSLPEEVEELYKRNGIIHIMAISGLHISMLGGGLYRLLRKGKVPIGAAGFCSVLFMWGYGMMTGMSASATRAILMFVMKMTADVIGRTYDMLTALSVAAVLLLIEQPLYCKHCGFLLSFGAIVGLTLVLPVLQEIGGRIYPGILSGAAIFLVSFPIQIYFYYQYPLYSIFVNLLIVPLSTVLMLTGLSVVGLGAVGLPAGGSALAGHLVLKAYAAVCQVVEQLPGAVVVTGQPEGWQIAVYYVLLILFVGFPVWKREIERGKKGWIRCMLPGFGIVLLLFRAEQGMEITFLDVGQGDAIYMRSESGKDYFIDGGSTSRSQVGKYQIVPFLKSKGVSTLEAVFISHGDADHCSGVVEILENKKADRIRVKRLILSVSQKEEKDEMCEQLEKLAREQGTEVSYIQSGNRIVDGNLCITCLSPSREMAANKPEDRNEESQVLYVTYGSFSVLFTGDITGKGEALITQQLEGKENPVTVLKVAHHGSKYSTDGEFLKTVKPYISVISCGEGNRYGHPHKETMERLKQCGTKIFQTTESGAVTIGVRENGKLTVEQMSP